MGAAMYENHEVLQDGDANSERRFKRTGTILEVLACLVASVIITGIGFAIARAVPLSWFG